MKRIIVNILESLLKIKISRQPTPRGVDLFRDLDNAYGLENFQTIFDIGANVGMSSNHYASCFPNSEIHSFEPVLSTYSKLQVNTKHISDRIHLVNTAIGEKNEKKEIFVNESSVHNSLTYEYPESTKELITVDTIDGYMSRNKIDAVDFVKVDTEGYELEVIRGAERALENQKIGVIYLESEPTPSKRHFVPFEVLRDKLSDFGYHVYGIYDQVPRCDGQKHLWYFNPVFVCNKLVEQGVAPNAYPLRD